MEDADLTAEARQRSEAIVSAETVAGDELASQTTMLTWPTLIPFEPVDRARTLYGKVFQGKVLGRKVIVKQARNDDRNARQAVRFEIEMAATFPRITPRCTMFGPWEDRLQVAYDFMKTDLYQLMSQGLSIDSNVPMELAKILSVVENMQYQIRDFRLQKFMASRVKGNEHCYDMKVISLHEAVKYGGKLAPWQSRKVKTTFVLPKDLDSVQKTTYFFGQILTRITLQLTPNEPISQGDEINCLLSRQDLCCRANLLRLMALRFLSDDPPSYTCLQIWPSSWDDTKVLSFMVRFYDRLNSYYKAWNEGKRNRRRQQEDTMSYQTYLDLAPYFECVSEKQWVTVGKIGAGVVDLIWKAVFSHELIHDYTAQSLETEAAKKAYVLRHIHKKPTVFGILDQLRNRKGDVYDTMNTFTATENFSKNYMSFWRSKFPSLVTAAFLIAINFELYKDKSFGEFFGGGDSTHYTFYSSFKDIDCFGISFDHRQNSSNSF